MTQTCINFNSIPLDEIVTLTKKELLEKYISKDYDLSDLFRSEKYNKIYNLKSLGWSCSTNNRKRAAGLCNKKTKTIFISDHIFPDNHKSQNAIKNTILHEIAHALDFEIRGKSNHDKVWKSIAKHIGCDGRRLLNSTGIETAKSKYELLCPKCKLVMNIHRKPKSNLHHITCYKEVRRDLAKSGLSKSDIDKRQELKDIVLILKQNY